MGEKEPQLGLPFSEEGDDKEGKKGKKPLSMKEIAAMQDEETNCPQCEIGGWTCSKHRPKGERAA